ncbi:hypothetical protein [Nonomuraea lactucae]|uniref:hypothetical protein n=1 Tax=Nonomuraea lactucae TaxID=2249762 RepID=UPI0013B42AA0|nr:hypothetical protein [Nonomuraea lactucae]
MEAVVDADGTIERASYELCVIVSLKDALRRREIYVPGAGPFSRRTTRHNVAEYGEPA